MRSPLCHALLLLGALLLLPAAKAQPGTDEQLAAQYMQTGDFEKAALYYERLYRKQPTAFYYEQYFKSLVGMRDLEKAHKLVREQMKRDDDPRYGVDLGMLLRMQDEPEKALQQFERVLKGMRSDPNHVRLTANAFIRANETDMALQAYERGQKLLKDGTGFQYEMANLYATKGDLPAMVRTYMDLLQVNEGYIQTVQNGLSRHMDLSQRDANSDILRTELIRRVQRQPDKPIFQELLLWMYIQQKDLDAAFVQARAMDKRGNEGGVRLFELAEIAMANEDHAMATKAFGYVLSLGRRDGLYVQARMGQLKAERARLERQADAPRTEWIALRDQYRVVLDELGRDRATVSLSEDLATLEAYHLNDLTAAIDVLENAIELPGLDLATRSRIKLMLGDVNLFSGDMWEASLLYSQVDLDHKYDPLGHEARLRNAKVSFYAGDFLWAKAQLDILKASTSKLIANDAMEISLRISDNIGLDSNSTPLSMFARADLLIFQRRFEEALLVLDSLDREFPMGSLGDDILWERHRIALAHKKPQEAVGHLERIVELYPLEILVDNALFEIGRLYETELKDTEKAKAALEKLLFDQPGSIFVPEARERYRRLRGDRPDAPAPAQAPSSHP